MSDVYVPSIFTTDPDPKGGLLTAEQLQARRRIATALATRNRPYPKTIGEGLTAFGEGLGEGYFNRQLTRAEALQKEGDISAMRGPAAAAPAALGQTSSIDDPAMNALALANADAVPTDVATSTPQPGGQMSVDEWLQRSARNETGAEPEPYRAIGERNRRGDQPYGKYQIMGENIPQWSKMYLGKELTPKEFLDDPKAQEVIARGRGSEYLAKYGPDGAAEAWFAGEKGRIDARTTRPALGAHVDEYVRKFNRPLADRNLIAGALATQPTTTSAFAPEETTAPIQLASLGGMPTPDTVADPATRDMVTQALTAQQQPSPEPLQQVAQAGGAIAPQIIPKAPVRGTQQPSPIPEPPPYPDYGKEPKPPLPTDEMKHWNSVGGNPYRSEETRLAAKERYKELKAAQDTAFTREHGIWKEHQQKERDYKLQLPKLREELKKQYLENLKKPQEIITGAETPQPVDPALLGTDRSPQRSRIPNMAPKPASLSEEDWAKQQAPELSKAVAAADSAEPDFKSMLRVIDEVRNHPGKEWGTGLLAGYAPRNTDAYAFSGGPEEGVVGQLKGKTFLSAYDKLRGGGAISAVEGTKASQATAAINPAAGVKALDKALDNLENQIRSDLETIQRKTNRPVTAWQRSNEDEVAPDKDQVVTGFSDGKTRQYLGGDPRDLKGSWKIVR